MADGKMGRVLAATHNQGKLREFRRILAPHGVEVEALSDASVVENAEETGETFAENALIKARAVHRAAGGAVVADDSGLCIDALGGRPGVYSARYLGEGTPYAEKMNGILKELEGVPEEKRTTHFACAIAYISEDGTERVFEGRCDGVIGPAPRGERGFGYGPLFYVGGRSFSELLDGEKDAVSHRARALRAFEAWLAENR